jgi:hypothetical protein
MNVPLPSYIHIQVQTHTEANEKLQYIQNTRKSIYLDMENGRKISGFTKLEKAKKKNST